MCYALTEFENTDSPKGTLAGDEVPNDTTMRSRAEIWNLAEVAGCEQESPVCEAYSVKCSISTVMLEYARYYWLDEQFGALIDYLENKGIYDETLVILQSDHGTAAKGTLYEQGSRILNFVRYPPLFGVHGIVLSADLVVSNVDLAATIFDLAGVTVPDSYIMDGVSWLDEVVDEANDFEYVGESCCEYRYIDVFNSRSIVSSKYQYIWRATEIVETRNNVDDLYPNTLDKQQLYDLEADPDQKVNLISDDSLSSTITMFQTMMRKYVESTCPVVDGECITPPFTFQGEMCFALRSSS